MKERVTAVISFLTSLGLGLFLIYVIVSSYDKDSEGFFIAIFALVSTISTILYVVWTKFGGIDLCGMDKMEYKNQILKKQIEQQELLKKLEK